MDVAAERAEADTLLVEEIDARTNGGVLPVHEDVTERRGPRRGLSLLVVGFSL